MIRLRASIAEAVNLKAVAAAITALLMVLTVFVASAAPAKADPDAVKAAQQKLDAIQQQNAQLELSFAQLDAQLTKANADVTRLTKDLATQKAKVDSMKGVVSRIALTASQTNGIGVAAQLLASDDASALLRQLGTMESVGTHTQDMVQQYQGEQAKVATTTATLTKTRDQIATTKQQQAELLKQAQVKEEEAKKILAQLTKDEQARLAKLQEEQAKAQAAAVAAREGSNSRSTTRPETGTTPTPAANPAPASGGAKTAVNYALSKVGYPYVYGATGPNAFDCSGLTGAAWRAAGVSLPRTSQGQYSAGVYVSAANLQPGDLVFYYSGISHVGIYIGNGQIVHAANSRSDVKISGLYSMPYMGARRVG